MADGFLTGLATGISKVADRRQKQKLELALQSQKIETEFALSEQRDLRRREGEFELFKKKEEFRRVTPQTTQVLGEMFAPEEGKPLFKPGQRISPQEAGVLLRTRRSTTGLDRKITDPNDPFLIEAAEKMGVTPQELAQRGVSIRELSLSERSERRRGVETRFQQGIDVGIRKAIRQVEARFASTEAIFEVFEDSMGVLSSSGRAAAIGKGLEIKIEELAQQATSNSPEDKQIRKAVAIFGRQRNVAALKITQGISGVQMREDEKNDIKEGLPKASDTLAYARSYLDTFEKIILSGKDAEILALVTPTSKNKSVISALKRQNRSETQLLKDNLRVLSSQARGTRAVAGQPEGRKELFSPSDLDAEIKRRGL